MRGSGFECRYCGRRGDNRQAGGAGFEYGEWHAFPFGRHQEAVGAGQLGRYAIAIAFELDAFFEVVDVDEAAHFDFQGTAAENSNEKFATYAEA
jgi:hypothetical protein